MSNIMVLERQDIVEVCKDGCAKYDLSKNYSQMLIVGSRFLVKYMQQEGLTTYTPDIGKSFRVYIHIIRSHKYANMISRVVDMLNAYVNCKEFVFKKTEFKKLYAGEFGVYVPQYLEYLSQKYQCQPGTIHTYDCLLNRFCSQTKLDNITPDNITLQYMLDFFNSIEHMKLMMAQNVKRFMLYLQNKEVISKKIDLNCINTAKFNQPKLPSYYTKEEVIQIENQISRVSIEGRRDYAMMLLASRLGLRSSDIRSLEFSNIDWDKNEISIIQKKTGKQLILPLTEDVGSAIIEYILHARPKTTKDPHIFVSFRPPYHVITASTFSGMVSKYIHQAGIDCKNRHYGSHSLRHSLATNLLMENIALPVISSVLGHSSTETTKTYLSIDIQSLLYCSHDVPMVDSSFYEQEGGDFYV